MMMNPLSQGVRLGSVGLVLRILVLSGVLLSFLARATLAAASSVRVCGPHHRHPFLTHQLKSLRNLSAGMGSVCILSEYGGGECIHAQQQKISAKTAKSYGRGIGRIGVWCLPGVNWRQVQSGQRVTSTRAKKLLRRVSGAYPACIGRDYGETRLSAAAEAGNVVVN
jgi:hypothetical protein